MTSLRILLVCEDIPARTIGGLGKHVVTLGNALIEAGHDVTLMGRDKPNYSDCSAETDFRGTFITGCGDPTRGWKERQFGVFNPWKRSFLAKHIAKSILARASAFDIVHYHGHLPMVGLWIPKSLAFLQTRHDQGSECITHIRFQGGDVCNDLAPEACAYCAHSSPGPLRKAISVAAVNRYRRQNAAAFAAHPVIFVSGFLRDNCLRAMPSVASAQAHIVHNFTDEKHLLELAKGVRHQSPRHTTLHMAGRIEPAKGIAAFVNLIAPKMPKDWRINIFGEGPERATLAASHDPSQVRLFGHRLLSEVQSSALDADLTVMPSLCEESFGAVTLEALRLGRPCFALRRGGTPELARYGAAGQLQLFDSLEELVEGVLSYDTSASRQTGGESADVRVRVPELMALYRAAIADSK
mgnify:CR=1 FL=1